ncbi:MAG: zinc/iron permease [Microgenomates group bacterium GW2011_GWC1_37_8]|nr:MAG: zinc/iron permease [Microgenomates group bacterium GW2011_GWC1_37_8]
MSSISLLFVYSFIGSVAGLIGGVVLLFKKDWAKSLATVSVPLAAGVLLALSLLDLLPEAVEEVGNTAFSVILIVFVMLFMVERFFFYLHHHQEQGETHSGHSHQYGETVVPLIIFGDTIHNFLDGVVIGTTFLINPAFGMLVSFSTFLHETPHEIADFGILLAKGWSRKSAFFANFFSALATFPGAFLTYFYAERIEEGVGILLALAAGFFLYVATTDFLPEATHAPRKYLGQQAIFLIVGIAVIVIVRTLIPEVGH